MLEIPVDRLPRLLLMIVTVYCILCKVHDASSDTTIAPDNLRWTVHAELACAYRLCLFLAKIDTAYKQKQC